MGLMVYTSLAIGAEVAKVGVSGIPIVKLLSLGFSAAKPVKTYIHGFGLFWENYFVGDSYCCGIVRLDKRAVLGATHFNERLA